MAVFPEVTCNLVTGVLNWCKKIKNKNKVEYVIRPEVTLQAVDGTVNCKK